MTMFFIPTTWRHSNDHSYGINNDVTAFHVLGFVCVSFIVILVYDYQVSK